MYLRLDKDIAQFLSYLDTKVGRGQYLFFLTADHGVAHIPFFLQQHNIPAGALSDLALRSRLNTGLQQTAGASNLVAAVSNYQVYLNDSVLAQKGLNRTTVTQQIMDTLLSMPGVAKAFDLHQIAGAALPDMLHRMVINGYNQKLSGDIQFLFQPQWFDGGNRGTTHGSWYPYDSRIPLLWYGWNIKPGRSYRNTYMSDIAPTLAALLHIQMPNASIGTVIEELLK
jgi:arylsulfatase A-like enzyme